MTQIVVPVGEFRGATSATIGHVEDAQDVLPENVANLVRTFGEDSMGAYRIAVTLVDGSMVDDVIVAWGYQVVRVGGIDGCPFDARTVTDASDEAAIPEIDRYRRGEGHGRCA